MSTPAFSECGVNDQEIAFGEIPRAKKYGSIRCAALDVAPMRNNELFFEPADAEPMRNLRKLCEACLEI